MNSRERVRAALNLQRPDRLPKDLGAMRSTGISCFVYPALVEALGLPPRRPRVHDVGQMLALPEPEVLDALGCDVVTLEIEPSGACLSNALVDEDDWIPYEFNGRLAADVPRHLHHFAVEPDGTVVWQRPERRMPVASYVFDAAHGGHPLDLMADLPRLDLKRYKESLETQALLTDEAIARIVRYTRRVRDATDRAILVAGGALRTRLGISAHGGLGVFPLLCLEDPDYVHELHGISTEVMQRNFRMLLPEIAKDVDVILTGGGDWGTQNTLIASLDVFRRLFAPYMRVLNDEVHRVDPSLKTFIHSCGAVYDLLDAFIDDCHLDVINPVQWTAGGQGYKAWKDKVRGRAALWGGGVSAQHTLPRGSVADVEREVREVVGYLSQGSGYVFNSIHNLLAEVSAEKVLALYHTAGEF